MIHPASERWRVSISTLTGAPVPGASGLKPRRIACETSTMT